MNDSEKLINILEYSKNNEIRPGLTVSGHDGKKGIIAFIEYTFTSSKLHIVIFDDNSICDLYDIENSYLDVVIFYNESCNMWLGKVNQTVSGFVKKFIKNHINETKALAYSTINVK